MKRYALCLATLLVASIGCTPTGLYGNEARYAPDFGGYSVSHSLQSSAQLLLLNPITRKKIRCQEQLEPYFGAVTRENATRMHDEWQAVATTLPLSLPLLPAMMTGVLLLNVQGVLMAPPMGLRWLMSSPSADSLYESGKSAFEAKRFSEAERLFERALAKRDGEVEVQRSSYFLGILYEREGRPRDAARAYQEFIERALVRDKKAYEEAEKHLVTLEPAALEPCRSKEPLTFVWPNPR